MPNILERAELGDVKRLPRLGRTAAADRFHRLGDTEAKQTQRDRVAAHILTHVPTGLRMFSLPGESWVLERQLAPHYPKRLFVACERDSVTALQSIPHLPGTNRVTREFWVEESQNHVPFTLTSEAALLQMPMWQYWAGCTLSHWGNGETAGGRKHGRREFNRVFRGINALWIDPFAPLGCAEYLRTIRAIASRSLGCVACAFSFLIGRDDPTVSAVMRHAPGRDALQRRAAFLKLVIEQCGVTWEPCDVFSTQAATGTVRYGTVLGLLHTGRGGVKQRPWQGFAFGAYAGAAKPRKLGNSSLVKTVDANTFPGEDSR